MLTINSVKILHAVRSAITAIAELLVTLLIDVIRVCFVTAIQQSSYRSATFIHFRLSLVLVRLKLLLLRVIIIVVVHVVVVIGY